MLAITAKTESGPAVARPTADQLTALLRRIGAEDDHFVVVERLPDEDQVFVQTWREGDGPFAVEFRDGGPDRHFTAETADADEVIAVFLAWARGAETWRTALDWRPAELYSTPGLDPETREQAEEQALEDIRSGFWTFEDVVQGVCDAFDTEETPVTRDEARRIVAGLWERRLAEQTEWPEITDADRVERAFTALDAQGLTARMHFTCCGNCALGEIGAERAEADRGFVFFHHQDTAAAAGGHGLSVRYGAYEDGGADRAEVGRTVADALTGAGLTVEWDGDPDTVVEITPLDWRRRLPAGN
ncbi:DUF6891 domain-containing protein [Streptomyces sp. YGL11-2]|uniref:DUF6891 domain-containing protein n=1 Tax=Streptomyces sp. YGL11-2 TaxID=3414028 RepID=UPI003CEFE8CA